MVGVIALACKYDAPDLYAEAIRRLERINPTTLAGSDALHPKPTERRSPKSHGPLVHLLACNTVFLINIARHLQLPELLNLVPYAFYIASISPTVALTHGAIRTPHRVLCGDVDPAELVRCKHSLSPSRGLVLSNRQKDAARNNCVCETLHPDDLRRVQAGKQALKDLAKEVTRCFQVHRSNISPACVHRRPVATNPCFAAMRRLSDQARKDGILTDEDLLARRDGWIDAFSQKKSQEGMLCGACKAHLKSLHKEARQRLWNDLTKHFDLADWP